MKARQGRHAGLSCVPAAIVSTIVLGCGSTVPSPSASPWTAPSATVHCAAGPPVVRWFVGLGKGTQPDQIEAQKAFVKRFNAESCNLPYLNLEIVPNDEAYDRLKEETAAGNAPDVIGPVGARGRNSHRTRRARSIRVATGPGTPSPRWQSS